MRILVIDDNLTIGMLLSEMLADMGHEVCGVEATAAAAVAAACSTRPDLMLVDVQLGAQSGVAVMAEVMRLQPVAHVFMSGAAVTTDDARAVVLQKPFDEPALAAAVLLACRNFAGR